MTEPRYTEVVALRARSLASFEQVAAKCLEANPRLQSVVLGVSQYFADEAADAVHESLFAFPDREPDWPHRCTYEAPVPGESRCNRCDASLGYGELDSNTEAVFAWSAFCAEWGGGEGDSALVDPIAIARRGAGGTVEFELVFGLVRPWLDNDRVAQTRDEETWDETDPPKPEPVRPPWADDERPLLDAVYARPLDPGPRRVLVDHWLERGDVRGEFGALSFDEPATPEARARRDELARLHGRSWVGPLQPVVSLWGARFARGPFPSRVVAWFDDVEDAERLAGLEDWAVVEALHVASSEQLFSKAMRGLTELTGVNEAGLFALQRSGLSAPIRTLGLRGAVTSSMPWSPTLEGVETLLIERAGSDLAGSVALPCWPKLKSVEVWFALEDPMQSPAWGDDRATEALRVLGPKLPPGATLTVGYLLGNGARGGVVAIRAAGSAEVTLESRLFSGDDARSRAEERLRSAARPHTEVTPVGPPPSAAGAGEPKAASPSALRRFLSRFGF